MKNVVTEAGPGAEHLDWDLLEAMGTPRQMVRQRPTSKFASEEGHDLMVDVLKRDFSIPKVGSVIEGSVRTADQFRATISFGWKEDAVIELKRESDESRMEVLDGLRSGNPIEVEITSSKDGLRASLDSLRSRRVKEELLSNIGERCAFVGFVDEMIENAGYIVLVGGVKCFMPGSLGGMNKLVDFASLLGKEVYVMPISYSPERECVVVSHREYLKSLVPGELERVREGDQVDGFVTGTSKSGVFVEFNTCLTGLIQRPDMTPEMTEAWMSSSIAPGTRVTSWVREVRDGRISLSSFAPPPSPWIGAKAKYTTGKSVVGKVKKIVKFGVFVELEPRVVGLLHRSYIDQSDFFDVGQEIDVVIVSVDEDERKIDLAL